MTEQVNVPKLRFSEFTSSWVSSKLGKLSAIRSASRVHREQWTDTGVPFFRSSDVVAAYKGSDNNKAFISYELFEELSEKSGKPKKDDLLVTGGGSIGIPYLIPNDEPLYFKDADLLWFKNKKALDGYFLYEFLITSKFRRYLASITHTGTISHYTIEQAKSTPITLPELAEQQKIASFLSKVDEKITLLTEKKAKLTEYKKGVMQQLFNGKWQEQDGKLVFVPPTLRFKADDGSEFPDWKKSTLGDIGKVKMCKRIMANQTSESGDIPFFKIGTFGKEPDAFISHELYNEYRHKFSYPNVGDILMSASGTLGRTVVYDGSPAYFQDSNIVWIENDGSYTTNEFLFYVYQIVKYQSEGGTIQRLYNNIILSAAFDNPSLKEQKKIVEFLSAIDRKIDLANSELEKAKEWKKGLLQQMFV